MNTEKLILWLLQHDIKYKTEKLVSMVIREDKMGQTWLLPPCINDLIPNDHICHLVTEIVKNVNVSKAENKYKSRPGNPAYSRRMLLRLVVQSTIDGVFSSRKISKLAHENVVYMYLTGNEKPDFRTICNFRKENKELIQEAFEETVTISRKLGLLKLGHLSTDGTKLKANASNSNTLSKEEIEEVTSITDKGIEIDEEEDRLYGDTKGNELPPELNTREKIRKKIKDIEKASDKRLKRSAKNVIEQYALGDENQKRNVLAKLDKAKEEIGKSGQKAVSLTDPEARFMNNKKKITELSYNPQITVDNGSGIIVACDVTQDCTDHEQLEPQIESAEENLGGLPEDIKISADNGYFSGSNLQYLEKKGLEGYIPNSKQAQQMKGKKVKESPYSKDKFEYDEKTDCFICPQGQVLPRKGMYEDNNGKLRYAYYGTGCHKCTHRGECAGKNRVRVITSYGYEAERKRMDAKMQSKVGIEEYRKRGETVEWPFGNIKQNLRFRESMTRGIENVKNEHNLVCIAHNLVVMWGILKRNVDILSKIKRSITCSMSSLIS